MYTMYFSLLRMELYATAIMCILGVLSGVLMFWLSLPGNDERQFVGEQQVVGLIARGAGWRESVSLSVECLLHRRSWSPDKEQQ